MPLASSLDNGKTFISGIHFSEIVISLVEVILSQKVSGKRSVLLCLMLNKF
jgi:hypothetical protein